MKNKKLKGIVLVLSLMVAVAGVVAGAAPVSAKSDNAKYKEYKRKYKNDSAKEDYFQIKQIKRDDRAAYQQMKNVYETYKHNKDAMTPAQYKMYKDYKHYKGYKKYKKYKDKVGK